MREAQAQAAEDEDYERADGLTETMARKKKEMKSILETYDMLERRSSLDASADIQLRREQLDQLRALQAEHMAKSQQYVADANAQIDSDASRVAKKVDKIMGTLGGVEEQLATVRSEIEARHADATASWATEATTYDGAQARLATASAERESLESELRELQRRLQKATEYEAKQRSEFERAREAFEAVKKPHEESVAKLVLSEQELQATHETLQGEMASTNVLAEQMASERTAVMASEEEHKKLLLDLENRIADQASSLDQLDATWQKRQEYITRRAALMKMESTDGMPGDDTGPQNKDVDELREKSAAASADMQSLSLQILRLQQESSKLRQSITQVEGRIDELQVQKNLAASTRDYKTAGTLNGQIKELAETRDGTQEALQRIMMELEAKNSSLVEYKLSVAQYKEELQRVETDGVVSRITALQAKKSELQLLSEEAIETEDFEGADMLQAELESITQFISQLREVHSIAGGNEADLLGPEPTTTDLIALDPEPQEAAVSDMDMLMQLDPTATQVDGAGETESLSVEEQTARINERIAVLEKTLQEAVEEEDYEKADALNTDIQALSSQRDSLG